MKPFKRAGYPKKYSEPSMQEKRKGNRFPEPLITLTEEDVDFAVKNHIGFCVKCGMDIDGCDLLAIEDQCPFCEFDSVYGINTLKNGRLVKVVKDSRT